MSGHAYFMVGAGKMENNVMPLQQLHPLPGIHRSGAMRGLLSRVRERTAHVNFIVQPGEGSRRAITVVNDLV